MLCIKSAGESRVDCSRAMVLDAKTDFSDQKTLAVLMEDEGFKYQETSEVSKTKIKPEEIRETVGRGLVKKRFVLNTGFDWRPAWLFNDVWVRRKDSYCMNMVLKETGLVVQRFIGKKKRFVLNTGFDRRPAWLSNNDWVKKEKKKGFILYEHGF